MAETAMGKASRLILPLLDLPLTSFRALKAGARKDEGDSGGSGRVKREVLGNIKIIIYFKR